MENLGGKGSLFLSNPLFGSKQTLNDQTNQVKIEEDSTRTESEQPIKNKEEDLTEKAIGEKQHKHHEQSQFVKWLTGLSPTFGLPVSTLVPDGGGVNPDHTLHRFGQDTVSNSFLTLNSDKTALTQPLTYGNFGALSLLVFDWGFGVWKDTQNLIKSHKEFHDNRAMMKFHLHGKALYQKAYVAHVEAKRNNDHESMALARYVMDETYSSYLGYTELNQNVKMQLRRLAKAQRYLNGGGPATNLIFGAGKVGDVIGTPLQPGGGFLNSARSTAGSSIGIYLSKQVQKQAKGLIDQLDKVAASTNWSINNAPLDKVDKTTKEELHTLYGNLLGHFQEAQEKSIRDLKHSIAHGYLNGILSSTAGVAGLISMAPGAGLIAGSAALTLGTFAYINAVVQMTWTKHIDHKRLKEDMVNVEGLQQLSLNEGNDPDLQHTKSNPFHALYLLMREMGHEVEERRDIARTFMEQLGVPPEMAMALEIQMISCREKGLDSDDVAAALMRLVQLMEKGARTELARLRGVDTKDQGAEHILSMLRDKHAKNPDKKKFAIAFLKDHGATDTDIRIWSEKPKDHLDQLHINHVVARLLFDALTDSSGESMPVMPPTSEFIIGMLNSKNKGDQEYARKTLLDALMQSGMNEDDAKATVKRLIRDSDTHYRLIDVKNYFDDAGIHRFLETERERLRLLDHPDWAKTMQALNSDDTNVSSGAVKFLTEDLPQLLPNTLPENDRKSLIDAIERLKTEVEENEAKEIPREVLQELGHSLGIAMVYVEMDNNPSSSRMVELLQSGFPEWQNITRQKIKDAIFRETTSTTEGIDEKKFDREEIDRRTDERINAWKNGFLREEKDKERVVQELEVCLGWRKETEYTVLPSAGWIIDDLIEGNRGRVDEFLRGVESDGTKRQTILQRWSVPPIALHEAEIKSCLMRWEKQLKLKYEVDGEKILKKLCAQKTGQQTTEDIISMGILGEEMYGIPIAEILEIWKTPNLSKQDQKRIAQDIEVAIGIRTRYTTAYTPDYVLQLLNEKGEKYKYGTEILKSTVKAVTTKSVTPIVLDLVRKLKSKEDDKEEYKQGKKEVEFLLVTERQILNLKSNYDAYFLMRALRWEKTHETTILAAERILENCGVSIEQIELWKGNNLSHRYVTFEDSLCDREEMKRWMGLHTSTNLMHSPGWYIACLTSEEFTVRNEWNEEPEKTISYRGIATESLKKLGANDATIDNWCEALKGNVGNNDFQKTNNQFKAEREIMNFIDLHIKDRRFESKIVEALRDTSKNGTEALRKLLVSLGHDEKTTGSLVKSLQKQVEEFDKLDFNLRSNNGLWLRDYINFQLKLQKPGTCRMPTANLMQHMVDQLKEHRGKVTDGMLCMNFSAHFGVDPYSEEQWINLITQHENGDERSPKDQKKFIKSYLHLTEEKNTVIPKVMRRMFGREDVTHINGIIHALEGVKHKDFDPDLHQKAAELVLWEHGATHEQIKNWTEALTKEGASESSKDLVRSEIYRLVDTDYSQYSKPLVHDKSGYVCLEMFALKHSEEIPLDYRREEGKVTAEELVEYARDTFGLDLVGQDEFTRELVARNMRKLGVGVALEGMVRELGPVGIYVSGEALYDDMEKVDRWVLVERCEEKNGGFTFFMRDSRHKNKGLIEVPSEKLPRVWNLNGGMLVAKRKKNVEFDSNGGQLFVGGLLDELHRPEAKNYIRRLRGEDGNSLREDLKLFFEEVLNLDIRSFTQENLSQELIDLLNEKGGSAIGVYLKERGWVRVENCTRFEPPEEFQVRDLRTGDLISISSEELYQSCVREEGLLAVQLTSTKVKKSLEVNEKNHVRDVEGRNDRSACACALILAKMQNTRLSTNDVQIYLQVRGYGKAGDIESLRQGLEGDFELPVVPEEELDNCRERWESDGISKMVWLQTLIHRYGGIGVTIQSEDEEPHWIVVAGWENDSDQGLRFIVHDPRSDEPTRSISPENLFRDWRPQDGMIATMPPGIPGRGVGISEKTERILERKEISYLNSENHIKQGQDQCGYASTGILAKITGMDVPSNYLSGKPEEEIEINDIRTELWERFKLIPATQDDLLSYSEARGGQFDEKVKAALLQDWIRQYHAVAIYMDPIRTGSDEISKGHWIVVAGWRLNENNEVEFGIHDPLDSNPMWKKASLLFECWSGQGSVAIAGSESDLRELSEKLTKIGPQDENLWRDVFGDHNYDTRVQTTKEKTEIARAKAGRQMYQYRVQKDDWGSRTYFPNTCTEAGIPIDPKQLYDRLLKAGLERDQIIKLLNPIYTDGQIDMAIAVRAKLDIRKHLINEDMVNRKPNVNLKEMLIIVKGSVEEADKWIAGMTDLLYQMGMNDVEVTQLMQTLSIENVAEWSIFIGEQFRNNGEHKLVFSQLADDFQVFFSDFNSEYPTSELNPEYGLLINLNNQYLKLLVEIANPENHQVVARKFVSISREILLTGGLPMEGIRNFIEGIDSDNISRWPDLLYEQFEKYCGDEALEKFKTVVSLLKSGFDQLVDAFHTNAQDKSMTKISLPEKIIIRGETIETQDLVPDDSDDTNPMEQQNDIHSKMDSKMDEVD